VDSRPALSVTKKIALESQPQVMKVYPLLAHGQWFSLGTPASSTTKTGHHDIAEIFLKVVLNTINQITCISKFYYNRYQLKVIFEY